MVASYYDLGDKTESGFNFVAFPHGRKDLGGVLTEAAIMAGLSDGRESNPVKRGAWVARKIIAEPPNDPPPERAGAEGRREGPDASAAAGAAPQPAGLHAVPLEDRSVGRGVRGVRCRRAEEAAVRGCEIHAAGSRPQVTGADDLKRYLAEDRIDQVAFSVLKHLDDVCLRPYADLQ